MGSLRGTKSLLNFDVFLDNKNLVEIDDTYRSIIDLMQKSVITKQYSAVIRLANLIKNNYNFQQKFINNFAQTGMTLLKIAITEQDTKMVNTLQNVIYKFGIFNYSESVLELAIFSNNQSIIRSVFTNYLKNNDSSGQLKIDAIITALNEEKFDAAETLLEIGKDIRNSQGENYLITETVKALVKEVTNKRIIENITESMEYGKTYLLPKVEKNQLKDLKSLNFLSILLNKGANIFAKGKDGFSLADVLKKQDVKLQDLVDEFHTKNTKEYAGEHTYLEKLFFSLQNHFSVPTESRYVVIKVVNDIVKSVIPIQQKIAYYWYKHQVDENALNNRGVKVDIEDVNLHKDYAVVVNMDAETIKNRWESAKTKVKDLISKFSIPSINSDTLKDYIENITDIKTDIAKYVQISCIGTAAELSQYDDNDIT